MINQNDKVNFISPVSETSECQYADAKTLYSKIESIKSTISMANADRPELWIQRQNLQDLYHQIILK